VISLRIRTNIRVRPLMGPAGGSGSDSGLVIDFPGARLSPSVPPEIQAPPEGVVRRIRVGAHPNKVRLVVEMDRDRDYEVHPFLFQDVFVVEIIPSRPAGGAEKRDKWKDPPVVR